MAVFYRQYRIEFHISAMVFCLIGGKVRKVMVGGLRYVQADPGR